eukprot:6434256-Lingulodinium_polyedra.AAC.1
MTKTGRALVVQTMACSCVAVPSPSRVPSWSPGRVTTWHGSAAHGSSGVLASIAAALGYATVGEELVVTL